MTETKPHCGICQCEWEEGHENTAKHKRLQAKFESKMRGFRAEGKIINNNIAEVFVHEAKQEDKLEEYRDECIFKDMGMAYAVIEMYDYGTVDQRMYRNAVKYILDETYKKFGTDDFRYKELTSLIYGDKAWDDAFNIRVICHAISVGCPHTTQEECEKARTFIEEAVEKKMEQDYKDYKRGKCSHCRHLESIKEKWDRKC